MKSKVLRLNLDSNKRILVTSDIHGGVDLLKSLLKKVNFCDDDYLFILGDLIEKGPKSLECVRYIMRLVEKGNTFVLKGNNDASIEAIKLNKIDYETYKSWNKVNSIYTDMIEELKLDINDDEQLKNANKLILERFADEINFLTNLVHIIETDRLLFAHAGIDNFKSLEDNDPFRVMKQNTFCFFAQPSPKLLFVGHYPTLVYMDNKIFDYAPKRHFKKNIISIDGGYSVKKSGQINMVIIDSEATMNIDYISEDDIPVFEVVEDSVGDKVFDSIIWNQNDIKVLEDDGEISLCLIDDAYTLKVPNKYLYSVNGRVYCCDYTNRILNLRKGQIVKKVDEFRDLALVKCDSIEGWVKKDKIKIKR